MADRALANIERRLGSIESSMVTREEFASAVDDLRSSMVTREEFHTTMDEVLTIVRRLDQERVFTTEWVRRIESEVDRIKKHLHLV